MRADETDPTNPILDWVRVYSTTTAFLLFGLILEILLGFRR